MARGSTVFVPSGAPYISSSHRISYCFVHVVALLLLGFPSAHSQIEKMYLDTTDLQILVDETHLMKMVQIGEYNTTLEITAQIQHPDIVQLVPQTVEIPGSKEPSPTVENSYDICAYGKSPGHSEVTFNITPTGFVNLDTVFLRVTVMHSNAIYVISYIMGWIYFAAWSVSFYPQIYTNFKRKSVVGLNFDYLALNIMGFTMYSLFNCGLYFSQDMQWLFSFYPQIYTNSNRGSLVGLNLDFFALDIMSFTMYSLFNCGLYFSKDAEYFSRHPRGLNPVQLNDVFFSLHASFATLVTIAQCFFYEREDQRVSITARGIIGVFCGIVVITLGIAAFNVVAWLDFLYYCSYIKLSITLIKYVPQAYMNYKRKSTVGWSIGNIFLDFLGGSLSILQMVLNAYNYDDWVSFFGDFTKFGLGLFSLIFDIFFILQHYVFYRNAQEKKYDLSEKA